MKSASSPVILSLMRHVVAIMMVCAVPAFADTDPELGALNPDEMSWQSFADRAERGESDMVLCSMGYGLTKAGDHETARKLFLTCAEAGYTGAMTWLGQLDNHGLGGEYNPDAAAEWDRRAAELGDPVGKFNYGLALMRGHGVAQNDTLGRQFVDEAASEGLQIAQRLQGAGYDLDEVTPDADHWKYAPAF